MYRARAGTASDRTMPRPLYNGRIVVIADDDDDDDTDWVVCFCCITMRRNASRRLGWLCVLLACWLIFSTVIGWSSTLRPEYIAVPIP